MADYVEILASMDAVFIQHALRMDKLTAAPKKARKLMFTDPFILHAIRAWIKPCENPYDDMIQPLIANAEWRGKLVEAIVATHFSRRSPTYYIKTDKGEIDIANIRNGSIQAIEVKWTTQLRQQDLKMIARMQGGEVWANVSQPRDIDGLAIQPLPQALFEL